MARELCKPNQQALFSLELNIVAFRELEGVQEVQILVGRQLNWQRVMAGLLASSALSTHTTTITVSNVQEQRKHRVRGGGGAARTFRPDTMRAFSSTSTSSPPAPLNRTGTFMLMSFALLSASDVLVSFNRPSGEPTGSAPAPAGPPALVPAVAVAAVRPDMAGLAEPTGAVPAHHNAARPITRGHTCVGW